jgi:formylglycine-generating enzyme required for sulfatase activity
MKCKNCDTEINKDVKFCPKCGAKVEKEIVCSGCGIKLATNVKFCPDCGTKIEKKVLDIAEPDMVFVQGSMFTMGCTSEQGNDCLDREKPAHRVTVSSFNISKYEITQAQWKAIMSNNPSNFKGDNLPVEQVSWNDVQEFIQRLNAKTGKQYRLPTEAEWEYAARGGNKSRGYKYSGSNNLTDVGWFGDNSDKTTHPVGSKLPNELGIYDMSGNVWEWCGDCYSDYPASAQKDPMGASFSSYRVNRGGSWGSDASYCRVACRSSDSPGISDRALGFRLVVSYVNEV